MTITTDFPRKVRQLDPVFIPLADGCRLAARIWLPEDAEADPVPAILEYVPYRRRDFTAIRDASMHAYYAGHGYAGVRLDLRGSGDSDGLMADEYLQQELDDAVEAIAWLAEQPWCSGTLGMTGISWGGFNALQVAALRPPALKAIITACSTDDRYADDIHFMGGCLISDNMDWASTMFGFNSRPPDPAVVGERWREMWLERLEANAPWVIKWLEHQARDAVWQHGSVCEDFAKIDCAVYAVGGWADGYSNAIPRLLAGLDCPKKGLVGPWGHNWPFDGRPGPAIGFLQEALRWWDQWLKGRETGIMAEPAYRVWMQESVPPAAQYAKRPGRWVAERSWPSPRIEEHSLALNEGRLETDPAPERALLHRAPQTLGTTGGEWCPYGYDAEMPTDQRLEDGQSLTFDTAPLEAPLELLGAAVVELEVAVDRPLALIAARLNDVAPDGTSARITYGLLNLTHRESHEAPERLEPGRRYRVRLTLNDIAQAVPAGHRLRLALSTCYWPLAWPSPAPVALTLYTGASRLLLPVRPPDAADAELPAFAPVETAPPAPHSSQEAYQRGRRLTLDMASGLTVVEAVKNRGRHHLEEVDVTYSGRGVERMSIREGDPLSAVQESDYAITLARGDWQVRTETRMRTSCTAEHFLVSAGLDAYEKDTRVFTKSWTARIPRKWV